jgi:hypothetical protein
MTIRKGENVKSLIRCAVAALVLLCITSASVRAQERGLGLGIIVGEPTGLSIKGWTSSRTAIDAGIAWSFRREGYMHAHVDYLWHFEDIINTRQQVIPYLGVGGRVLGREHSSRVGIRIAGGLAWLPQGAPLDVILEMAPIIDLAPETELSANVGIGVRFFFR